MEGLRRNEKEIKNIEEIKKILSSTKYITIAMSDNNHPYLVTLSHGYDSEKNCLYFHCASQGWEKPCYHEGTDKYLSHFTESPVQ